MKKQILLSLGILAFLGLATVIVILYGEGYRFGFGDGRPEVVGTGLLVTTSNPNGAQVFVNGHLTTATNNTINLFPGNYSVKIFKDGYFPWQKEITIQKEVVSKADALLFPSAPQLVSITQTGVTNPVIDPTFTKVAYTVASQSAHKNGIYVLDLGNHSLLSLQGGLTQIVDDTTDTFSQAQLSWSPDGKSLLATVSASVNKAPTTYLLDATSFTTTPNDVSETLSVVTSNWNKLLESEVSSQFATLKKPLATFLMNNAKILAWSPDETKILYQATSSAALPQIIIPPLIGTDPTPEVRALSKGAIYSYDTKEDKNFKLLSANGDSLPQLSWYADSQHLIYVHNNRIDVMEYDGQNQTTVYAGPFEQPYVYPGTDGASIVIMTNLDNPDIIPNLYSVVLK